MSELFDDRQWMRGFPPADENIISASKGNSASWPERRWSFSNMQQLVPTKTVWRGTGVARDLETKTSALNELLIETEEGRQLSWQEAIDATHTDGLAFLHKGQLKYEAYTGYCGPHNSHLIMSSAKSFAGLLAEMLIADGKVDEDAFVPHYLPELSDTAWKDATVRQVMDMLISMEFHEDYLDPSSDVWRYLKSGGMVAGEIPQEEPQHLAEYLATVKKSGEHGQAFAYREPNINVLTFIIQRVLGCELQDILSDVFWSHIGAEHDGYYMVDPAGCCTTFGCTLRDFLRFGEYVRLGVGKGLNEGHIFNKIIAGGDPALFAKAGIPAMKGWSYKSQWWIRHQAQGNAALARGAYGQILYIDPANELVVAKFASSQLSPGYLNDPIVMPMIDAAVDCILNA